MKKWTRWQDWVAVVVGLYAALSVVWTPQAGLSRPMMITLGLLLVAVGVWNLARPDLAATEWVVAGIGALLVVAPWVGGFATEFAAAWTAWATGAIAVVVGLWAVQPARRTHDKLISH